MRQLGDMTSSSTETMQLVNTLLYSLKMLLATVVELYLYLYLACQSNLTGFTKVEWVLASDTWGHPGDQPPPTLYCCRYHSDTSTPNTQPYPDVMLVQCNYTPHF